MKRGCGSSEKRDDIQNPVDCRCVALFDGLAKWGWVCFAQPARNFSLMPFRRLGVYVYEVNVCDTYGGVDVSVNAPGGPVLVLNRYTYIVFYQVESFTSCEKEKEGEVSGGCSLDSGCACIWELNLTTARPESSLGRCCPLHCHVQKWPNARNAVPRRGKSGIGDVIG